MGGGGLSNMLDYERLYSHIGDRIRTIRESQSPRMSQEDLAVILDLKRTSVTNIERGRQKLTLETVYRFCDRFGLETHELLPSLTEVRARKEQSVVIGGQSHAMGSKTADVVARLRPARRNSR
jgi:transcriptional regulator with XRE-family HTH domain